jgi:hypothetical protein
MELCHLHNGINRSHWGSTSVGTPEFPFMSNSTHDLPNDNVQCGQPPEDGSDEETIDLQKPDQSCTPNATMTRAHWHVVGGRIAWGKSYGNATGLYNK